MIPPLFKRSFFLPADRVVQIFRGDTVPTPGKGDQILLLFFCAAEAQKVMNLFFIIFSFRDLIDHIVY